MADENVQGGEILVDDFDKAFTDAIAQLDKTPASADDIDPAKAEADAKVQAEADAKAKAEEKDEQELARLATEQGKSVEDVRTERGAAAAKADVDAKAKTEADAKAKADAEAAEKIAADARAKATADAKAAADAIAAPYEPTAEEKDALEKFKKEFPGEAVAIEARLKAVGKDVDARIFKAMQTMLDHVEQRVAPVEATATETAIQAHVTALHKAHSDYDAVSTKVPDWIKTLPSYAQAGATAVYEQGTTEEVIALVADYKKANGVVADPAKAEAEAKAKAETEAKAKADAEAKARGAKPSGADDLTPVSSRRTTVLPKGSPDANDFDGAFSEAVKTLGL